MDENTKPEEKQDIAVNDPEPSIPETIKAVFIYLIYSFANLVNTKSILTLMFGGTICFMYLHQFEVPEKLNETFWMMFGAFVGYQAGKAKAASK